MTISETQALIEDVRREHHAYLYDNRAPTCFVDNADYPCTAARLAAELETTLSQRDDAYDVILQTLANLNPHGPLSADDRALFERVRVGVHEYKVARASPVGDGWPAQQRRIAAKIAERYEQEAP